MTDLIGGGKAVKTPPKNPQDMERLRAMAQAMMPGAQAMMPAEAPRNSGGGLQGVANALLHRSLMSQAPGEATAGAGADNEAAGAAKFYGTPVRPAASARLRDFPDMPGTMKNARTADRNSMQPYAGTDLKSGIRSTAAALGVSPVDLGTAMSYETGGTWDPTQGGPVTQHGKHRGLIQFGEPQADHFGIDWNDPLNTQLGPEGAVAKYMKDAGVVPGMGMLDLYSAINAGHVGRYDASDANNGGAAGTVRDKVENQMAGHRANALKLLADPTALPERGPIPLPRPEPELKRIPIPLPRPQR